VRRAHRWLRRSSTARVGEASERKIGRRDARVLVAERGSDANRTDVGDGRDRGTRPSVR
jgi:hypothetical protein